MLTINFLIAVESATNPRHLCHGMAFALAHYVGHVTVPIAFPKGVHHSMVHNDRGWSVWWGVGGRGLGFRVTTLTCMGSFAKWNRPLAPSLGDVDKRG
jgi:hypothetical protein